jgi:uncharacterized membrane protein
MYNDLIIMTFPNKRDALIALLGLDIMRDKELLGLGTITIVTIEESGRTIITQAWDLTQYPHNVEGRVPGGLARILCDGITAVEKQKLHEAGLDPFFMGSIQDALTPDSSAVLHYIPRESLTDTNRLLDTMSRLQGTLYHTTFPKTAEETILQGLEYNAGASMQQIE